MKLGAWIAITVCGLLGFSWLIMSIYAMITTFGHFITWGLILSMFCWTMLVRQEILR